MYFQSYAMKRSTSKQYTDVIFSINSLCVCQVVRKIKTIKLHNDITVTTKQCKVGWNQVIVNPRHKSVYLIINDLNATSFCE